MKTVDSRLTNPFPGLRPFRSDEHHLFFGREEQTAALLQLLRTNRFLAVVGTSGSGKSSLVRAGMIAELHGGTMTQAGSTWEVMILRPGGSPIENLARAFVDAQLYDPEDPSTLPRLLATLNRSRFGLVEAMKQSELFGPGTNLLVVVDQFEELFRFRQQGVDSEETAAAFVNLLLTASEQTECPIYVAITMRSDYLGDCSEIPGLAEAVNEGEYLIPRLQRDQKRDAIEKPIGVGGAKIAPMLVQRLLNEVGDDPDQLPVLQHALMRMWDAWSAANDPNRPIDFADFEATGGLAAALSNHADEIFDALPDDGHRSACAKIFKTLTEKGDDNRGIRRPTRLARLQAIADADRDTVTTVLDAYRGAGVTFLMPGTEVELGDRTVLDLSHESLMRGWQRLRMWVEDEAQSARIFRRLLDTARLWGDGKAGLFRDPDLQIALCWREQEAPNAEWAEQYGGDFETAIGFLKTSNAEMEAERQAREAARQRELEQARQLADSERARAEVEKRSARRLRVLLAGAAMIALIAVGASLVAFGFWREASLARRAAEQSERSALSSAAAAKKEAERATAQELAAQAAQRDAEHNLTSARTAIDSFLVNVSESQLLTVPGLQPLRQDLLRSALSFYEDFINRRGQDASLRSALASVHLKVARIQSELKKTDDAAASYGRALALYETLAASNPGDAGVQDGLAESHLGLGETLKDRDTGRVHLASAVTVRARLVAAHASDAGLRAGLARAYQALGFDLRDRNRKVREALAAFLKARDIAASLVRDRPADPDSHRQFAENLAEIAECLCNLGRHQDETVVRPLAIEHARIAYRKAPQVLANGRLYAGLCDRDGVNLVSQSRIAEGIEAYRRAAEVYVTLARENPDAPDLVDSLTGCYLHVIVRAKGDQLRGWVDRGRHDLVSLPGLRAQFGLARLLAKASTMSYPGESPDERGDRQKRDADLAVEALKSAAAAGYRDVQELQGDALFAALAKRDDFTALVAGLGRSGPGGTGPEPAGDGRTDVDRLRASLAASQHAIGLIQLGLGDRDEARKSLSEAIALLRSLADAEPTNEKLRTELSVAESALAKLLWDEGRLAEAIPSFKQVEASLEQALQKAPDDQAVAASLADLHRTMADSFAEAALWEEAVPYYAAALKPAPNSDPPAWTEILAPAMQLLVGDEEAYRTGCAQILKSHGMDTDPEPAARVARLYALRPVSGDDIARIVALAGKAKSNWHAYTYALVLYRAGRFEEAIRTIEEARKTKTYGSVPVDNFVLAMAHFQLGRPDRARKVLNAVNLQSPRSMPQWAHFVNNMLDVDWIVLHREANELIHGSPYSGGDRGRRGRAYARLGDLEKAVAEFSLIDRSDPLGHFEYAHALAKVGRKQQAGQILEMAQRLRDEQHSNDVECRRLEGETLTLLDRHAEAILVFRHAFAMQSIKLLIPQPANADRDLLVDVQNRLADALRAGGRAEEASGVRAEVALLLKVVGLPPLFRNADDLLAAEAAGGRDVKSRISGVDQLLAINEKSLASNDPIRSHLSARLHQRRAELMRADGRPEQEVRDDLAVAREQYEQSLAADPQSADLAAALADLLLEASRPEWTVLKPTEMKSKGGATLKPQPDDSILASGINPDRDNYTLVGRPRQSHISAIRLEALPDPSLPLNGPGRGNGGIYVLNELRIFSGDRPAALTNIIVINDENQAYRNAIDGKIDAAGGWSNSPSAGNTNTAIVATSLDRVPDDDLKIELYFGGENRPRASLGRFRLSVSEDGGTFDRERKRFAVLKLTDPWLRLAFDYAVNGRNDEAAQYFSRALKQANSYGVRKQILEVAARFEEVLSALIKRQPDDPHLQLVLARRHAERGKQRLAEKQPAQAQAELEKTCEIFRQLRATVPETLPARTPQWIWSDEGDPRQTAPAETRYFRRTFTLDPAHKVIDKALLEITADNNFTVWLNGTELGSGDRWEQLYRFDVRKLLLPGKNVLAVEAGNAVAGPAGLVVRLKWTAKDQPEQTLLSDAAWYSSKAREEDWSALDFAEKGWRAVKTLGTYGEVAPWRGIGVNYDLKDNEIAGVNVALARAYAQQGQTNEAVTTLIAALPLAADRATKAAIITAAAALEGALEQLAERAAGDGPFQIELARHFAGQGNAPLADAARTRARALLEEKLAKEPENSVVALELADLLLIDSGAGWTVLKPTELKSKSGATLTLQSDGSILASGINAPGDIYTVSAVGNLERIAAVRLEALLDPSLPNQGPGRHSSGNFHLSAFRLHRPARDGVSERTPLPVESAWASFDYKGPTADIAGTIDGTLKKAWHVWGRTGEAHEAVFLVPDTAAATGGRPLVIELHHGTTVGGLNLGRFRLSVSGDPAIVARERHRFAAMKLTDPWVKLAAAYRLIGDQPALDTLLKHHRAAAASLGDLYVAEKDWEQAIAEYLKAITGQPANGAVLIKLAATYQAAGRTREAVPYLATASTANPNDTGLFVKVGALQAWFGQDKELADTCEKGLSLSKDTKDVVVAERVAKICSLRRSDDTRHESALVLARRAVELGKGHVYLVYFQMALGMAEYRTGHFAEADAALSAAMDGGTNLPLVAGTSAFYRAMSLFRQGKNDGARKLAAAAAATMKPLPADEQNPFANDASADDLILWLAYKEAKALIPFDSAPPPKAETEKK
jgi:tetratricopeptide (TPR) repeat protein